MEDKRNNRPRQRNSYGSTDGFVNHDLKRRQAARSHYLNRSPVAARKVRDFSSTPAFTPPSRDVQQPRSLLNTTLTGHAVSPLLQYRQQSGETKRHKKKLTKKKVILRSVLVILALFIGVGGYLGIKGLNTLNKVFHGNDFSDITAAFNEKPLKGESTGRVNILLAGDSADDPDHQGAQLTDSILLLSVDTQNHSAFLLSIPRDLWVYVPGLSSYQKINAANDVTNFSASGYPSGGMGELEQIVQTQLGIPIDYYGLMDYGAFRDAVNAVGGVTINIQSPDSRGLYDSNADLKLPNGPVTLDGQQALNLARARGDGFDSYGFPNSDFDRTEHQRQLFIAVAEKAKTLGVITNPVKISDLFNTLGNNLHTDLSLQNVLRLIQITKGINPATVASYAFSSTISTTATNPLLESYTDPVSGQEALIPTAGIGNYGQLQQYYQQLTSNNPIVKESPSVVILNASDVVGLAKKQENILQSKGYYVAAIADAYNEYPSTMIVDNSNATKPNSLKLLQQLYPGTTVTSDTGSNEASEAQGYTADFVVILGKNWDSSNTQ